MKKIAFICLFLIVFINIANASPNSFKPIEKQTPAFGVSNLPPQLKGWDGWAKDNHDKNNCDFAFDNVNTKYCYYISSLILDVNKKNLNFKQKVNVLEKGYVLIPGSFNVFPSKVIVNSIETPVVNIANLPYLLLDKGEYDISGQAKSKEIIRYFSIPTDAAILTLKSEGKEILNPSIDDSAIIRLETAEVNVVRKETDDMTVSAFRKIEDAIPIIATLRIDVNVSGSQRVENLGNIIPNNFTVTEIKGSVPAYIRENGDLMAEVKAGSGYIEVGFRQLKESLEITLDKSPVESEIWVLVRDSMNRRVIQMPNDILQIQTKTTNMPTDWKQHPGYEVKKGETLNFNVIQYADKQKDNITLQRNIKLSFDGAFYSIKDNIAANFKDNGRLSLKNPFVLSSVSINGEAQSIVTDGKNPMFEVRQGQANIETTSRLNSNVSEINTSGYGRDFDNVNWNLQLSPGYKLFYVSGADDISDSWISNWNLMGIFIVILLGVVFYSLFGFKKALIAEVAFVLINPVFPGFTIIGFILCAIVFATRYLEKETIVYRFINFVKYSLILLLAIATFGFATEVIREAIYPGISSGTFSFLKEFINYNFLFGLYLTAAILYFIYKVCSNSEKPRWKKVVYIFLAIFVLIFIGNIVNRSFYSVDYFETMSNARYDAVNDSRKKMVMSAGAARFSEAIISNDMAMEEASVEVFANKSKINQKQIDQNMIQNIQDKDFKIEQYQSMNIAKNRIQTGVGFPTWHSKSIYISIKGPVTDNDYLKIYLISPIINLVMTLLQILFGVLVIYYFVDKQNTVGKSIGRYGKKSIPALLFVFALLFAIPTSYADNIPSVDLLKELEEKLTRETTPICIPNCLSMPEAWLEGNHNDISLNISVHAQNSVVLPLPTLRTDGTGFVNIREVVLNGKTATSIIKQDDVLNILVDRGINNVQIKASLDAGVESFNIVSRIGINLLHCPSDMFEVVENQGNFQVRLQNKEFATKDKNEETVTQSKMAIEPFFRVERMLDIATIWQVTTRVHRLFPLSESASINVPLLNGEKVISTEGILAKDSINISFAPNERYKEFHSLLPVEQLISLKAPNDGLNYKEIWQLNVDLAWSFEIDGVKPIKNNTSGVTIFTPYAGETLDINVFRLKSFEGEVITFDKVEYSLTPGRSKTDLQITLDVRSSEGGVHNITLPSGVEVTTLLVDNQPYPVSQNNNILTIPVNNGESKISFSAEIKEGQANIFRFPKIDLKVPSVNISQTANIPVGKWILFLNGPVKGPAVLFWSQIPILLLLAFLLSKIKICPVSVMGWFVLLLGLSQSNILFSIIIVVWFILIALREKYADKLKVKWAVQSFLLCFTLLFIYSLINGISEGLMGTWDMNITGNGSYLTGRNTTNGLWILKWYQDAVDGILPTPLILSLPSWVYRTAMILWSAWLAFSFVKWIKWGAQAYKKNGMW